MKRSATAIPWQDGGTLGGSGATMNGMLGGVLIHSEHFHQLVETLPVALYMTDATGRITYFNKAAENLWGRAPLQGEFWCGSYRLYWPDGRPMAHDECPMAETLKTGRPVLGAQAIVERPDGTRFPFTPFPSPIFDTDGRMTGAVNMLFDAGDPAPSEALPGKQTTRLATLNRVSKMLSCDFDLERIVQAVTDVATELSGARFGAFFYNVVKEDGEEYQLYSLSGASREAFEKLGMPRNTAIFEPTFRGTSIIRSDDIRKDPRYGRNAPHHGMPKGHLPVVSYLAVPVISASGAVLGGLFFGHDKPAVFSQETEGLVVAVASLAAFAIDNARLHRATEAEIEERRRIERANELLVHEIKHRVKNTLGTVQAMAVQTFRQAPLEERNTFVGRLHALAEAHDALTQHEWGRVALSEMAARALHPFADEKGRRISSCGADPELSPNRALLISMVLHELGSNAVKFGALSNDEGRIEIVWDVSTCAKGRNLRFVWKEVDGPAVTQPERKGFGRRMIEHAVRGEQGASEFRFEPSGLVCTIEMPI